MDRSARAVEWLKYQYKNLVISELGEAAADFLDRVWGLHHLSRTSLGKVDWSNDIWIEIVIGKSMATVDNDDLTRLVVIAHQMMLRVDLKGIAPGYIKLKIHQRTHRDQSAGFWAWCPDIIEHVKTIQNHHPAKPAKGE